MKRFLLVLVVLSFIFNFSLAMAVPPNQAEQDIQMEIKAINTISVSGNPQKLIIDYAEPGQNPDSATDDTTTYSVSTNGSNKKIVGSINAAMPDYTGLKIRLEAPAGASSAGQVILSTTNQDLVTGISKLRASGLGISYEFFAQIEAEPQEINRTVTLILTGGGN